MKPAGFTIHPKIAATPGVPDGQDSTPKPVIQKNLPYLHTKAGTEKIELNMEVQFIDTANTTAGSGEVAACRHFSSVLGLKALATPNGKIALSDVDSPDKVARNITTHAEQAYQNIRAQSRNASVFENDQFAAFLQTQFRQMEQQNMAGSQPRESEALPAQHEADKESVGESDGYKRTGVKTFLIESTNHTMLLRLRVKEKQGTPLYVISFYDPNRTACLVRCQVSNLKELQRVAGSHSLAAFINPVVNGQVDTSDYDTYFPADTAAIALALEVPDREHETRPSEVKDRCLQRGDCKLSPVLMFYLMDAGFAGNIDAIVSALKEDGVTPAWDVLAAKGSDGTPGLFMALQNGHADAIRAWGDLLAGLPDNKRAAMVKDLLAAKDRDGTPGLFLALQEGHADAILAWGAVLAGLPDKERAAMVKDLLAARRADRTPGLFIALKNGHADAIRAWGTLLKWLPDNEPAAMIKGLLEAEASDGTPGLYQALQLGYADAISAWGTLLKWLPDNERAAMVKDLMAAKDSDGTPGLYFALQFGRADAIRAWGKLLNDFPANTLVTRKLAELIFAIRKDGVTAERALLVNPNEETATAWTALLAHLPPKLRDAAMEALQKKNKLGTRAALRRALDTALNDKNA